MEVFKDIKGYEGSYQVSDLANVKSLPRVVFNAYGSYMTNEKLLKQQLNPGGFMQVTLCSNAVSKTYSVALVVADAFFKQHKSTLVVKHINGIRTDNKLTNLMLTTQREAHQNRNVSKTSTFTGVSWSTKDKIWVAAITINKKVIYLGAFKDPSDASDAYQNAIPN